MLREWMPFVLACTTLGLWVSFRRGSGLMLTAWTIWNGSNGRAVSSARTVVSVAAGGSATDASCAVRVVYERR